MNKYVLRQIRKHGHTSTGGHPWTHSQGLCLILNKQTEVDVNSTRGRLEACRPNTETHRATMSRVNTDVPTLHTHTHTFTHAHSF